LVNILVFDPGVFIYRVTPHCFAINFEEIPSWFVLNVFVWLLCITKWSDLEVIFLIPIFGVIFGHNFSIWPPGVSLCSVTTCCWAINFEEILSCFVVNVFCSYFVLPKGPNWEVICIIPIFGVILVRIWDLIPPPGDPF
jgi:hypothetical protein